MSITLHNGWRLGHKDVFDVSQQVKDEVKPFFLQEMYTRLLERMVREYDLLTFDNGKYAHYTEFKAEEHKVNVSKVHECQDHSWLPLSRIAFADFKEYNENTNVEVVYLKHPKNNELFCFVYGEIFVKDKFVDIFGEPFSYWDNANGPKDISKEDWDERKVIWESLLNLRKPSPSQGLTQKLLDNYELTYPLDYFQENIVEVPSVEARASSLADVAVDTEMSPRNEDGSIDLSVLMSYMASDERASAKKLKVAEISATLEDIGFEQIQSYLKLYR